MKVYEKNPNQLGVSIAAALSVENLSFEYTEKQTVLEDISFTTKKGAVNCLLGESGCGKTTLLRIIAGLEKLKKGQITLDGFVFNNKYTHCPPEKRNIGFIFQDYAIFPHLSVLQNVAYGLHAFGRKKRCQLAKQILNIVNLEHKSDDYPASLSGGERQRIALARTIITRPELLLMDEPFSNLDQELRGQVRQYTIDILKKTHTSTIIVTHEPREAMTIADKIIFMDKGKIVQIGTPDEIYKKPATEKVLRFFANVNSCTIDAQTGFIVTPFGCFTHNLKKHNGTVNFLIRHEDLQPVSNSFTPKGEQRVIETRIIEQKKLGREDLLSFYVEGCSQLFSALCTNPYPPCKPGMNYRFMLDPVDIHIFENNRKKDNK